MTDWSGEELWRDYIQLTQAEAAFRVHKSDLQLRPIWHQKEKRVQAHILVCFLAYVLWKTLGQLCQHAGLGDDTRTPCSRNLHQIQLVEVVLPTRSGWRFESVASVVPPSTKPSCFNGSDCSYRRVWKRLKCGEDFDIPALQMKDLLLQLIKLG